MEIAVIGGGAAGFFGAIHCAEKNPEAKITIIEKSNKLLSKVKISGGGRCNVTNACLDNNQLVKNYPRGSKQLKELFKYFSTSDTIRWFESRDVKLKAENDGRIFPVTDNSQTIVDCLIREADALGITIQMGALVSSVKKYDGSFLIEFKNGESLRYDKVLVATGGSSNNESYDWLRELGHEVISPLPSLFTFNVPDSKLVGLQGLSVQNAKIKIIGTTLEEIGPALITHWGFSGPAILRLSAWGARALYDKKYNFDILINWIPDYNENLLRDELLRIRESSLRKIIFSNPLFSLPRRLWERLVLMAGIDELLRWSDLPKKNMNKLIEELLRGCFAIRGKTTFKEEFVTCGGVDLENVNLNNMESIQCPGLFFAGEVLNIDGITGGFNFQAAWTTGWVAGKGMSIHNLNDLF